MRWEQPLSSQRYLCFVCLSHRFEGTTCNLAIPCILEAGDSAWAPAYLGSDRIELQLVFKLGSVCIAQNDS